MATKSTADHTSVRGLAPSIRRARSENLHVMPASYPHQRPVARLVNAALAPGRSAHERQRELVRASLLTRPVQGRPTHRRWA
jgi:hypothetical protein